MKNIVTIVGESESLIPIDAAFHSYQQGRLKPLGNGLYRCYLFNQNNAVIGYAMYDNGTSIYCDEPHWLGYCVINPDADNSIYCEHCGEFIYAENARYMEDAPATAPRHYAQLKDEHLEVCWKNPSNKHLIKSWKKEVAYNHTYGFYNMLTALNVSRFTVVLKGKSYSTENYTK